MDYYKAALELHEQHKGKIEVTAKVPVKTRDDLSAAYTPAWPSPCREIAKDPAAAYTYTAKGNLVAVVTNGTAVLGLGDIGAAAAMPVMEGKAILFKEFGGVDAFPICLDTKDPEQVIEAVRLLAPTFGGVNLEDISSPNCFYIEETLEKELDIPVFHDDQHGTAIVVTAALLGALRVVKKGDRRHPRGGERPGRGGHGHHQNAAGGGRAGRDRLRRKRHFVQRAGRGHRGPQKRCCAASRTKAACAARWPTR